MHGSPGAEEAFSGPRFLCWREPPFSSSGSPLPPSEPAGTPWSRTVSNMSIFWRPWTI